MTPIDNMRDLIKAVGAALEAGRADGSIRDVLNTGAPRVWYGYASKSGQGIPFTSYPYILIDDSGERTEIVTASTQNKFFLVELELMTHFGSNEDPLFDILDFSEQVKTVLELEKNRFSDGMTFGIQITPILFEDDQGYFYRGRRVVIEYKILEDRYEEF